jgi:hypothetical protein
VRNLVSLRDEHRSKVFEQRQLRRISGPKKDEATDNYTMRNFCCRLLSAKYYQDDQIKDDEMGRVRSTYGINEKYTQDFR